MLTLEQIRQLTGHTNTDAVRMALRRGKARSGVSIGAGSWPPKKCYERDDVWRILGDRILDRAAADKNVRAMARDLLGEQIRRDVVQDRAAEVYPESATG